MPTYVVSDKMQHEQVKPDCLENYQDQYYKIDINDREVFRFCGRDLDKVLRRVCYRKSHIRLCTNCPTIRTPYKYVPNRAHDVLISVRDTFLDCSYANAVVVPRRGV